MNTFNINRVFALLRYDWTLSKQSLKHTSFIVIALYVTIVMLSFFSKYELGINNDSVHNEIPALIGTLCYTYFHYAACILVLVVTTLLTQKFCYPRTATSYLTLPGTSLEKFVVLICDYAIAFIGLTVVYVILFYLTMGVCHLYAPELDWGQNAFKYLLPGYAGGYTMSELEKTLSEGISISSNNGTATPFVEAITSLVKTSLWLNPFTIIGTLVYYMILNMFFRSNVQVKAFACFVGTDMVLIIAGILFTVIVIGHAKLNHWNETEIMGFATKCIWFVNYALYTTPLIAAGLFYFLYRQICRKQAK